MLMEKRHSCVCVCRPFGASVCLCSLASSCFAVREGVFGWMDACFFVEVSVCFLSFSLLFVAAELSGRGGACCLL